jgi:peptide/nickel transport system permease protein
MTRVAAVVTVEWRRASGLARAAALTLATVVLVLALGPLLVSHAPTAMDLSNRLQAPSSRHWFGTDELGRDLWSRVVHGGGISLGMSLGVVALGLGLGTLVGLWGGLVGGRIEAVMMRIVDVMLALPPLVLAMALAAARGPGLGNAMLALVVVTVPTYVRLARAQALQLRSRGYLEAAQLAGASLGYRLRVHVLPNAMGPLIVQGTLDVSGVMLASAALGFIGLGAQPPTPEWGSLIASGQHFVKSAWWYPSLPGLAILLCALSCNVLGDALRDRLDPKA